MYIHINDLVSVLIEGRGWHLVLMLSKNAGSEQGFYIRNTMVLRGIRGKK